MKIAIYTLTRDRIEYTKHCFGKLYENAGYPFKHFILDNGSTDGTQEYLKTLKDAKVFYSPENIGISAGSNLLLDEIMKERFDLVIKFDNDCEIPVAPMLGMVIWYYRRIEKNKFILSPQVYGINKQPHRGRYIDVDGRSIGITAIVGGLFQVVPYEIFKKYRFPTNLKPGWGQDDHFCDWAKKNGYEVGYMESPFVNHYETTNGQIVRYPEYFKRKNEENK